MWSFEVHLFSMCLHVYIRVWGPCMYVDNVAVEAQLSEVHSLLPYRWVSLLSALAWLTPG